MANYDINLTFGYANSDSKHTYTFGVDSLDGAALVTKVKAINASLAAGTSDSLNTFFIDDSGNPFSSITAAEINSISAYMKDNNIIFEENEDDDFVKISSAKIINQTKIDYDIS